MVVETLNPVEQQRRTEDRAAFDFFLTGGVILYAVVFVYNAVAFTGLARTAALLHDAALFFGLLTTRHLLRRGSISAERIEAIRGLCIFAIGTNIATVAFFRNNIFHTTEFGLLIVVVGAFVRSPRLALVSAFSLTAMWFGVLGRTEPGLQWYNLIFASCMAGLVLFVTRHRATRTIDALRHKELEQRLGLEAALLESNTLRQELDMRVEARTEELTRAMASLRKEHDAREALAEQLQHVQRMELIGSLAGSVAHDFNNQLTVIRAGAEVAASIIEDDEARAHLEDVNFAAQQAAGITRQLLLFSRKQVAEPTSVDLSSSVGALRRTLIRLIRKEVQLEFSLSEEPLPVRIDLVQLEQIIVNLVVNARDASPKGRVEVSVEHQNDGSSEWAVFSVSDNGTGMTQQVRDRIFEPFFTTKPPGSGTGLGLAIVQRIVTQHAGEVSIDSVVGEGTTVRVALPICKETEENAPAIETKPTGQGTILAVDDQPKVLKMAVALFESLGYRVISATSGTAALEQAKQFDGDIDILWTDVLMPEMNGRELAEIFKVDFPQAAVVFASGYTADVLGQGELPEHTFFVAKPYSMRTVSDVLGRIHARAAIHGVGGDAPIEPAKERDSLVQ